MMSSARPYVRDLLRLAGPVALARLGIICMGLVDVIVVGQLAPDELAHQGLGWAPTAVFLVASIGLLTGVQVLSARAVGEKNPAGAGVALRRGLVIAAAAGIVAALLMWLIGERLFSTFGIEHALVGPSTDVARVLALSIPLHLIYVAAAFFLEGIKKPIAGTIVMWLANGVNLGLNLLWVPEHGAVGSAWATVGARVFLVIAMLACVWLLRERKLYGVTDLAAHGPSYRALLAVGIAAAVSQAVEAGAFAAMTVIAGRLGAHEVAAYQILLNLLALVFMVAMGLGTATAVLVSEAIGRKAPHDAARAGWTGLCLNTIGMAICAVIILALPGPISRGYTADLTLAAFLAAHFWVAALVLAPDGGQVVLSSALRARSDNWFPTFSHIFAYALVMPVLGFWFGEHQGMGVEGLIFAIFWSSVASAAVLLGRWWFLTRRSALPYPALAD